MRPDPEKLNMFADKFSIEIPEICFAFLFGSMASGKASREPDIDLGLYISKSGRGAVDLIPQVTLIAEHIFPGFLCDIVILNEANVILSMEVLKGKLFYLREEAKEVYAEFYSLTCRMYEDETAWMKKQLQYRGYEVQWSD